MLLSACSPDISASGADRALGATNNLSARDEMVLAGLGEHPRAWNRGAEPLIRDYLDPNVGAGEWVSTASDEIIAMRQAYMALEKDVMLLTDAGVRSAFTKFVENYRAKLDAVVMLHIAVSKGDQAAETDALSALAKAARFGKDLATTLVDDLRPFMSDDDVGRLLAE